MCLSVVIVLGVAERYYAFRLHFDAGLFDSLARSTIISLDAVDKALLGLGLSVSVTLQQVRPLADRVRRTRRLMQHHTVVVVCQSVLFFLALLSQGVM